MSDPNQIVDYGDPALQEIQVVIGGKDYLLREASGEAKAKYENVVQPSSKLDGAGRPTVVTMGNNGDAGPVLLSLCLFYSDGTLVGKARISSWPSRITDDLTDRLKKMSHIGQPETREEVSRQLESLKTRLAEMDDPKDGPTSTTGGSG